MTNRTDWLMRQYVDQVMQQVATGQTNSQTAAKLLRDRMVPQHVAQRVITRALTH